MGNFWDFYKGFELSFSVFLNEWAGARSSSFLPRFVMMGSEGGDKAIFIQKKICTTVDFFPATVQSVLRSTIFLFSIISMKLECEAYLNIHMMLSVVCGLTILIITSINIKQLIRTVYRLQEPCTFMNATKHQYCDRAEQQVMNTNPFPTAAACFSLFEKSYFRNFTKFYSK